MEDKKQQIIILRLRVENDFVKGCDVLAGVRVWIEEDVLEVSYDTHMRHYIGKGKEKFGNFIKKKEMDVVVSGGFGNWIGGFVEDRGRLEKRLFEWWENMMLKEVELATKRFMAVKELQGSREKVFAWNE